MTSCVQALGTFGLWVFIPCSQVFLSHCGSHECACGRRLKRGGGGHKPQTITKAAIGKAVGGKVWCLCNSWWAIGGRLQRVEGSPRKLGEVGGGGGYPSPSLPPQTHATPGADVAVSHPECLRTALHNNCTLPHPIRMRAFLPRQQPAPLFRKPGNRSFRLVTEAALRAFHRSTVSSGSCPTSWCTCRLLWATQVRAALPSSTT